MLTIAITLGKNNFFKPIISWPTSCICCTSLWGCVMQNLFVFKWSLQLDVFVWLPFDWHIHCLKHPKMLLWQTHTSTKNKHHKLELSWLEGYCTSRLIFWGDTSPILLKALTWVVVPNEFWKGSPLFTLPLPLYSFKVIFDDNLSLFRVFLEPTKTGLDVSSKKYIMF